MILTKQTAIEIIPKSKNAICQLVMNSDQYVLSAIALIVSIKQQVAENRPDFIVFTHNITEQASQQLALVADHVIPIELICYKVNNNMWPRFQHNYAWLESCFSKFYAFKLVQYAKVLFLDSDMLCLADMSKIFQLQTPAGCLVSKSKSGFHSSVRLPEFEILSALMSGYGVSGACWMISPKLGDFELLLQRVEQRVQETGFYSESITSFKPKLNLNQIMRDGDFRHPQDIEYHFKRGFNAGPDEQLLTWFYFNEWVNISRQFCCVPWLKHRFERGEFPLQYVKGSNYQQSLTISDQIDLNGDQKNTCRTVYLIHYVAEKPWQGIGSGKPLWPDCKLFFDMLGMWAEGKEYVVQVFGEIDKFEYMAQKDADATWDNDFRRKFDK
ncbi:Glycosyl_transferase family 8 protein [Hexamita inflata]|uniref:Glycosyl transferase family 8 protein n=1 Tax=Hexamita inflata TaxID=28002 RepID=A0AA86RS10_9EUKA|nr:Glycosyl transferase family 8 protein [Hexamita inflata]